MTEVPDKEYGQFMDLGKDGVFRCNESPDYSPCSPKTHQIVKSLRGGPSTKNMNACFTCAQNIQNKFNDVLSGFPDVFDKKKNTSINKNLPEEAVKDESREREKYYLSEEDYNVLMTMFTENFIRSSKSGLEKVDVRRQMVRHINSLLKTYPSNIPLHELVNVFSYFRGSVKNVRTRAKEQFQKLKVIKED